jgi:hypothetical protein
MPRRVKRAAGCGALLLVAAAALPAADAQAAVAPSRCSDPSTRVGVYLAPLEGDSPLSRPAAVVISMQIWETLRKADPAVPGSDFGCALVERIAPQAPQYSGLRLAGDVWQLGNEAVVELSLEKLPGNDHRKKPREIWTVAFAGKSVSYDPIKSYYAFATFPIRQQVLANYPALTIMRLCRQPRLPCAGGPVGFADLDGIAQNGDFAMVRLGDGRQGWLYIPAIGDHSEVVDFVAAVVRLQRGDYNGADDLLQRVDGSIAGTGLKVEALLLRAVARELSGRSGDQLVTQARLLNPLLRSVAQVEIMGVLQAAARAGAESDRKRLAGVAKSALQNAGKLFDPSDGWFKDASILVAAIEGG